jgi:phospholipid/cholesterol/gamma-HCH transport system permease protein
VTQAADFQLQDSDRGRTAVLTGDWTAVDMGTANERLAEVLKGSQGVILDLNHVDRFDTSGAYGVLRAARNAAGPSRISAPANIERLLDLVHTATQAEPTPHIRRRSFHQLFERIGRGVIDIGLSVVDTLVFNGHLLIAVGRAIRNPRRVRWAAVIDLMERAGLDAIPVIATTTFFIGAVVGLLGANMLKTFGAQVFVVELIGVAVLREFNVLITALLLAGRSASSFAAEIGAMKMNQEIDAMKVLGVDPFDALVFPRFAALFLTIPLLVFIASLAGLAGGLLVASTALGIGPDAFFQRMLDNVGITNFWVGLSKAPIMAVVIAGIGCRQGMEVGGDVESLGRRVTAAVVHAIFAAILIDAVFALIYMKLNI